MGRGEPSGLGSNATFHSPDGDRALDYVTVPTLRSKLHYYAVPQRNYKMDFSWYSHLWADTPLRQPPFVVSREEVLGRRRLVCSDCPARDRTFFSRSLRPCCPLSLLDSTRSVEQL
jgi:hypothetical protein